MMLGLCVIENRQIKSVISGDHGKQDLKRTIKLWSIDYTLLFPMNLILGI